MDKPILLELKAVSKTYDMGEVKVEALRSSDINVYRGELLAILGPSGSGKSTLLNLLGGMDRASEGSIIFDAHDLAMANDQQLTDYRRREVGFVFQFYNLIPDLTARENVELAAELVDKPLSTDEVLREVGLYERRHHFPSQLSGGEQQRVSIARALVKNPRLVLCDEPTGALDFETGKMVLSLLDRINREWGTTVIIVTHNSPLAALADRVIRMRSGQVASMEVNADPVAPENIVW